MNPVHECNGTSNLMALHKCNYYYCHQQCFGHRQSWENKLCWCRSHILYIINNNNNTIYHKKLLIKVKLTKSTSYSCFNHRTVKGKRLHGPVLNMLHITRMQYMNVVSLVLLFPKWRRRRDTRGFVHAHSNCHNTAICTIVNKITLKIISNI